MAALVGQLSITHRIVASVPVVSTFLIPKRYWKPQRTSKLNKVKPKKLVKPVVPETKKLDSVKESLASRGFLRCYEDYTPPEDAAHKLESLFAAVVDLSPNEQTVIPPNLKFELLERCFVTFKLGVPNSILHRVNTYGDLQDFYLTPIDTTIPYDKMKSMDLPPNLHIQYEPIRFHPEEDTKFGGQTAFPKSNTLVTGLRTRRKFKGHIQTERWPIS